MHVGVHTEHCCAATCKHKRFCAACKRTRVQMPAACKWPAGKYWAPLCNARGWRHASVHHQYGLVHAQVRVQERTHTGSVCVCVCMWVCTHDACKGRCVHPLCIQVCALRVCVCTGAQEVCSGGVHPCLCTRECASVCMHREHTHTSALWVCKCKRVHEPCKGRRELCKKGGCAKVCMKLCTHKRAPGARASPCTRSVCKCKREHDLCTAARARGAHTCECCGAQHVHERARLCTPGLHTHACNCTEHRVQKQPTAPACVRTLVQACTCTRSTLVQCTRLARASVHLQNGLVHAQVRVQEHAHTGSVCVCL